MEMSKTIWHVVKMPAEELSEYQAVIRDAGRREADFNAVREQSASGDAGVLLRRVTVRGQTKTMRYPAGGEAQWIDMFLQDLTANRFQ